MFNTKISAGQVFSLLLFSRLYWILYYVPVMSNEREISTILYGNLLAMLIMLVMIIPACILYHKNSDKNVIMQAYDKSPALGTVVGIIYMATLLLSTIGTVFGFEFFITNAVYPNSTVFFIVFTVVLVAFLCAACRLEGVARAAWILFAVFIAILIFISFASVKYVSLLNIKPLISESFKGVLKNAFNVAGNCNELIAIILLFPSFKGGFQKVSAWVIIISCALHELINFFIVSILGDFASDQTFPYYTLVSLIETKIFQRLDSAHLFFWIFVSVIKITLNIIIVNQIAIYLLPNKARKWIKPVSFVIICGTATIFSYHPEWFQNTSHYAMITAILCVSLIPAILCFGKKSKAIKEGA